MKAQLQALRDGVVGFDQFVAETMQEWTRLAAGLLRANPSSQALELDDVRQAMLLAAWRATREYDPGRGGMTLHGFVVYRACSAGKREIRTDRHTHRKDWSPALGTDEVVAAVQTGATAPQFEEALTKLARQDSSSAVLIDATMDLQRCIRSEEERRVIAALIAGAKLADIATEVFPEEGTGRRGRSRARHRARVAALVCLSRLEAEERVA